MFNNNNLIKNLQLCFGFFLITVLILTSLNVAYAANTVVCPEELPVCNATTLANYNKPVIGDEMEETEPQTSSIGIQSITDQELDKRVKESKDLGAGDALRPQSTLPSNTAKSLDVPYMNQYMDRNGKIWGTRYHCGAAAGTMISGYFNKLPYKGSDDDLYKKYMNTNSGQGITETCNGQGGAFGITGYPDRSSSAYCRASYPDGVSKYLKKIGLKYKIVAGTGAGLGMISIGTVKAAINRGNPLIISSGAHYYIIKGYTTDNKIIVNDSWKDASKTAASVFVWGQGKNAVYDLKNLYPFQNANYQNVRFAWEVSTSDTSFYNSENTSDNTDENPPVSEEIKQNPAKKSTPTKAEPIATQNGTQVVAKDEVNETDGLNVRSSAGGEIVDMVEWGTKGVITDGPKTAMGTSWNKVRWETGIEGWSAKKFLSTITNSNISNGSNNTNLYQSSVKYEKPTEYSIFTNIKLASDESKCIDLNNSKIVQYNSLQVWNCNDTIAQNFIVHDHETNPEGFGRIKLNSDQAFCIDFNGPYHSPAQGLRLYLTLCDNWEKSSTEWFITEQGEIKPAYDDTLCIGLSGNKTTKATILELQTCNDSQLQKFVM